ncbi:MAG: 2-amino-4-hydroxy-6-hydroxymethyldihydropteridine diphosphokinase [Balneolales bacterium]
MAQVVIALGSNLGDRQAHLSNAKKFLSKLSTTPVTASSIYETEPVGEASTHMYYNAVCLIRVDLHPLSLLEALKNYEQRYGRDPAVPRWANRTIDLDIIDYDRQFITRQRLHVPHPEYAKRLFVLIPLKEICPDWTDLQSGQPIDALIAETDEIQVSKTRLKW